MPRKTLIEFRRDTAANFTATNPVLAAGEPGFETDTGKLKIGDGSTVWASLAYINAAALVSSVFGRAGAVVAANGDYEGVVASALTGATAATRYVGGTATNAPSSGTFAVGDFVIAQNGHVFICTVAGTPGTWVDVSHGSSSPLTTKGDVWGYSTADARIPVGGDGTVLTADSTQALGVKWGTGIGSTYNVGSLVVPIAAPNFVTATAFTPGASLIWACRVVIPKTGTLNNLSVFIVTSAGNLDAGVYDTSATTRNRLYHTGSIASPGTGWRNLGNPGLSVTVNDEYDFAIVGSSASLQLARQVTGLATSMYTLPSGFLSGLGGTPFLGWDFSAAIPLPATLAEASMTVQGPVLMIATVT